MVNAEQCLLKSEGGSSNLTTVTTKKISFHGLCLCHCSEQSSQVIMKEQTLGNNNLESCLQFEMGWVLLMFNLYSCSLSVSLPVSYPWISAINCQLFDWYETFVWSPTVNLMASSSSVLILYNLLPLSYYTSQLSNAYFLASYFSHNIKWQIMESKNTPMCLMNVIVCLERDKIEHECKINIYLKHTSGIPNLFPSPYLT